MPLWPFKKTGNTILLSDLVGLASIGIHDFEKQRRQQVRVNIKAVPMKWPFNKDDIADTVSYDDLKIIAERHIDGPHIELVETLAERIAQDILKQLPVASITVRVEKTAIYDNATPGVEIVRKR